MQRDALERHPILRLLLYLVTIIAVLYAGGLVWQVILHFSGVILLFFLSWIISFILQPLSIFLQRRGVPRLAAVALIYLALLCLAAGVIVLAIPAVHSEVQLLGSEATAALTVQNVQHLESQAIGYLHHLGLSETDAKNLVNQITSKIPTFTANLSNSAVQITTSLLGTAATLLFDAILVLILSFYMMLDGDRLLESWLTKLPPAWLPDIRLLQRHVDSIFGGFLRAQIIIGVVYGAFTWLVLAIVGMPNGLLFAFMAGLLMLIPFIGPFLAVVPPALVVLLQSPPHALVRNLLIVLIALGISQQITMQVIAPRVMSAQVGLHPLLLFAALLVGAEESGVWGAVFAGPVAAVVVAMLDTFFERFQQSSALYPDIVPEMAPGEGPPKEESPPPERDEGPPSEPGTATDGALRARGAAARSEHPEAVEAGEAGDDDDARRDEQGRQVPGHVTRR